MTHVYISLIRGQRFVCVDLFNNAIPFNRNNTEKSMSLKYVIEVTMLVGCVLCYDEGFDLFFKTNLDEMKDVEIYFENPVPKWIKGTLVRNGLGRFEVGQRKFLHAFDAFGKLASWKFYGNGSVSFSTRMLQSEFYQLSQKNNDIAPFLMFEGVSPAFNELEKLEALSRGIDNMNVNVYSAFNEQLNATEYFTLNDFWKVYQFDPFDLSTVGPVTAAFPMKKHPAGKFAFLSFLSSAHPLPEKSGNSHFTFLSTVSLVPWIKSTVSLIRINSLRDRQFVAQWNVDKVPYMHSFSVTEHYVILFQSPFYVNVMKMVKTAEPFESLDWFPEEDTEVIVVNIDSGEVKRLKTENMFSMHFVNAFEMDDGKIVVDASTYPNPDFVGSLQIKVLMDKDLRNSFDAHALLRRYVIDLKTESVELRHFEPSVSVPFSNKLDMPVINENYRHVQYCYIYGIVLKSDEKLLSNISIVKKNVCNQPHLDKYWHVDGHYPVEPWFVPHPQAMQEDHGNLMVPVIDGHKGSSYLAILDAQTLRLVNKAYLPTVVPYNLHGRFFPDVT